MGRNTPGQRKDVSADNCQIRIRMAGCAANIPKAKNWPARLPRENGFKALPIPENSQKTTFVVPH